MKSLKSIVLTGALGASILSCDNSSSKLPKEQRNYKALKLKDHFCHSGTIPMSESNTNRTYNYMYQEFGNHSFRLYLMNQDAVVSLSGEMKPLFSSDLPDLHYLIISSDKGFNQTYNLKAPQSDHEKRVKNNGTILISRTRENIRGYLRDADIESIKEEIKKGRQSALNHERFDNPIFSDPSDHAKKNFDILQVDGIFRSFGTFKPLGIKNPTKWDYFMETLQTPTPHAKLHIRTANEIFFFSGDIDSIMSHKTFFPRYVFFVEGSDNFASSGAQDFHQPGWGNMGGSDTRILDKPRAIYNQVIKSVIDELEDMTEKDARNLASQRGLARKSIESKVESILAEDPVESNKTNKK